MLTFQAALLDAFCAVLCKWTKNHFKLIWSPLCSERVNTLRQDKKYWDEKVTFAKIKDGGLVKSQHFSKSSIINPLHVTQWSKCFDPEPSQSVFFFSKVSASSSRSSCWTALWIWTWRISTTPFDRSNIGKMRSLPSCRRNARILRGTTQRSWRSRHLSWDLWVFFFKVVVFYLWMTWHVRFMCH